MPPDGAPAVGARVVVYPIITCGHCAACLSDEPLGCRSFRMLSEAPLAGGARRVRRDPGGEPRAAPRPGELFGRRVPADRLSDRVPGALHPRGAAAGHERAGPGRERRRRDRVHPAVRGWPGSPSSPPRGTRPSERFAVDLGAEAAFPLERETTRALIGATGGVGVDAVIDTVGEPTWDLSLKAVKPGGVVVVPGATGGPNPPAQLNRIFYRSLTVAGTTMGTRGELRRLVDLCATGALRPLIGSTRNRSRTPRRPSARWRGGELRGKIVLEA